MPSAERFPVHWRAIAGSSRRHGDRALRNLTAEGIRSDALVLSQRSDVAGVRSSGYVEVNGAQLWVRYSTYCRGSNHRHGGLVVEEVVAVPAILVAQYGKEIGALSAAVISH